MPATATAQIDRAEINRANSQHSTGPRTGAGKQRSSLNALRHGLTACTAVLPSENQAAYEQHHRQFLDEYQPANATETQLVKELADTSWRLNRIPILDTSAKIQGARCPGPIPASRKNLSVPAASRMACRISPSCSIRATGLQWKPYGVLPWRSSGVILAS